MERGLLAGMVAAGRNAVVIIMVVVVVVGGCESRDQALLKTCKKNGLLASPHGAGMGWDGMMMDVTCSFLNRALRDVVVRLIATPSSLQGGGLGRPGSCLLVPGCRLRHRTWGSRLPRVFRASLISTLRFLHLHRRIATAFRSGPAVSCSRTVTVSANRHQPESVFDVIVRSGIPGRSGAPNWRLLAASRKHPGSTFATAILERARPFR